MLPSKANASTASNDLAFGRFVIQSAARQVRVDNQPVKLGARAFDLLMTPVERRDCVVSKLGHHAQAARLAGRANANIAASGFEREQSELRAARMTEDLLRQAMSEGALNALMNEGSAFTDEAAIRAALGIDRRSVGRAA